MSESVKSSSPASPAGADFFCRSCPRRCGAGRSKPEQYGFCRSPKELHIARAAPHFGEEPCISGSRGSGAVFFTGCNLRCVFCQNHTISREAGGMALTVPEFRDLLYRLEDRGVHNINLVTGTHYTESIAEALSGMRLSVPVVWNSSAYESTESLRQLKGLVQIFLPDYKYAEPELAADFSAAPDYPSVALAAIREMYRQTGPFVMSEDGLLRSGVLLRHLILPGHIENTLRVMDLVEDALPVNRILFSLMSQYTPLNSLKGSPAFIRHPELGRTLLPEEYQRVSDYLDFSSIEEGYFQELSSATEEMIPDFDLTGV